MSTDVKYDFTPHDGTPGKSFEDFEDRLLNYLSREVDDRGWSLADHLLEIDEGGANGPDWVWRSWRGGFYDPR